MAYSRWGSSTWYTFWSADGENTQFRWPTERLKRSQCFQVCDFPSYTFTYGEMMDKGIDVVLVEIGRFYSQDHSGKMLDKWEDGKLEYKETDFKAKNPTEDEVLELFGYMLRWEADVNEHFKFWTFMRFEWWYPIRNQILWKIRSIKARFFHRIKNDKLNEEHSKKANR